MHSTENPLSQDLIRIDVGHSTMPYGRESLPIVKADNSGRLPRAERTLTRAQRLGAREKHRIGEIDGKQTMGVRSNGR